MEDETDNALVEADDDIAEELPVRPHLQAADDDDLGARMGAPRSLSHGVLKCQNALILSMHEAMTVGCVRLRYSRDNNTYSNYRARLPPWWTVKNLLKAVDNLTSSSVLVDHRVPPRSPASRGYMPKQSTLSAGPAFIVDADLDTLLAAHCAPPARIILRDKRKRALPVPGHAPIVSVTSDFQARFDAAVGGAQLEVDHPSIDWVSDLVGYAPAKTGRIRIDLSRRYPVRIFTKNMISGGRWYRVFWVEVPKSVRHAIRINGMPVFEHDYTSCHIRLAYAAAGASTALAAFGDGDLYALRDFGKNWRWAIKRGVNIMFNAASLAGARRALARKIEAAGEMQALEIADAIINGIKSAHPELVNFWHSGCGIGLQFVDSEIARLSVEQLLSQGVLALPVHDSLLVAEQHRVALIDTMDRTFEVEGQRLAQQRFARRLRALQKPGFCVPDLTIGRAGLGLEGVIVEPVGLLELLDFDVNPGGLVDTPTCLEAKIVQLVDDPASLLSDLAKLVFARGVWSSGIVWAALLAFASIHGNRRMAASAIRSWSVDLPLASPVPPALVHGQIARLLARTPRPASPAVLSRHCPVTAEEAVQLGLVLLAPPTSRAKRNAQVKRARRMIGGKLPNIIPIKPQKPWIDAGVTRTAFFEQSSEADRQVLALRAIIRAGDPVALQRAVARLDDAQRTRREAGTTKRLPVDNLIDRLNDIMRPQRLPSAAEISAALSSVVSFGVTLIEVAGGFTLEPPAAPNVMA